MARKTYCADFETTSMSNLEKDGTVRVWLWSLVSTDGEEMYGTTIDSFMATLFRIRPKKVYFHNLRFDGSFIVDWLLKNKYIYGENFNCIISDMNVWYEISLNIGKDVVKIWDSLKKFPEQSVENIAKLYGIEGKKAKPYFEMYRPVDYKPTPEEIEYCLQDSRIVARAI